jgi:hypothetical protein
LQGCPPRFAAPSAAVIRPRPGDAGVSRRLPLRRSSGVYALREFWCHVANAPHQIFYHWGISDQ